MLQNARISSLSVKYASIMHRCSLGMVNNLKCSWGEVIDVYQKLVTEISQNVQLSVIDKGPYKLAPAFIHLTMTHKAWSKLNVEERRRHLARIDPLSKVPHTVTCL